jgi:hypothetical protein
MDGGLFMQKKGGGGSVWGDDDEKKNQPPFFPPFLNPFPQPTCRLPPQHAQRPPLGRVRHLPPAQLPLVHALDSRDAGGGRALGAGGGVADV